MTHTSLVLGGDWPADEWPDYVEVEHDDGRDRWAVRYAPERTCTLLRKGLHGCNRNFECSACGKLIINDINESLPKYCKHCGARVEGER